MITQIFEFSRQKIKLKIQYFVSEIPNISFQFYLNIGTEIIEYKIVKTTWDLWQSLKLLYKVDKEALAKPKSNHYENNEATLPTDAIIRNDTETLVLSRMMKH